MFILSAHSVTNWTAYSLLHNWVSPQVAKIHSSPLSTSSWGMSPYGEQGLSGRHQQRQSRYSFFSHQSHILPNAVVLCDSPLTVGTSTHSPLFVDCSKFLHSEGNVIYNMTTSKNSIIKSSWILNKQRIFYFNCKCMPSGVYQSRCQVFLFTPTDHRTLVKRNLELFSI